MSSSTWQAGVRFLCSSMLIAIGSFPSGLGCSGVGSEGLDPDLLCPSASWSPTLFVQIPVLEPGEYQLSMALGKSEVWGEVVAVSCDVVSLSEGGRSCEDGSMGICGAVSPLEHNCPLLEVSSDYLLSLPLPVSAEYPDGERLPYVRLFIGTAERTIVDREVVPKYDLVEPFGPGCGVTTFGVASFR